jgi:hypothetical protein
MRPTVLYNIPTAALGFWQSIRDGLKECVEIHNFDPDVVVIDTNLHFASLLRTTSEDTRSNCLKRINLLATENNVTQLNIWYIWTLASLHRTSGDLRYIATNLHFFDTYLNQRKQYFNQSVNFVHVLNPFALYSPFIIIESPLESHEERKEVSEQKIETKSFSALAKIPVGNGVRLEEFYNLTSKALSKAKDKYNYLSPQFLEAMGEELKNEYQAKRPRNVAIIPFFDTNVVGFTDYFITDDTITYHEIKQKLSSFSAYFDKFLVSLQASTKK